jgi:tryptophan-rich sensory protein
MVSTYVALRDSNKKLRNKVNNTFLIQLLLQILWCFSFFAEGQIGFALAVVLLLGFSVFKMISIFLQINKLSGFLLYPYYWWVIFATFLNAVFVASKGMIIVF